MVIDNELAGALTRIGEEIDSLIEMYPGLVKVEVAREVSNEGVKDNILVTFANGYLRSISRTTTQYSASFRPVGAVEQP